MMKIKELLLPGLVSILPAGLILLDALELIDVFTREGEYDFGSEFAGDYSIYTSKEIYVLYLLFQIIVLLLVIYFAFKRKRKLCAVFLFIGAIIFLYPIFTARH